MGTQAVSRRRAWLMAARPQTLPAAAAPVVVGIGLALGTGVFAPLPALAALVGALLIQVGTNFANDYYDAKSGVDSDDREGFTRVTQSGLIEPPQVRSAMIATFTLAILVGVYLVYVGGVPIIVIGLASVAAGVLYAGGPYPFGSYGLGDLFVFVFFGLVAVTGTYYVQAAALATAFPLWLPPDTLPLAAVVASLPAAALSTNILVVNNLRDRETDEAAGKRSLAVIIGYRWSRVEFVLLLGMAYTVPVVFWLTGFSLLVLAPLLTIPYAVRIAETVVTHTDGNVLNPALSQVGKLLAAHSVLSAFGLALPGVLG
ncbi:1,4-dihydroxy-2-naphthoate polyprenyltransferase [Halococcus sp. IIIV-5B]|uniref:1,4-dihydroxy-2-naphthoate polyprenyltransferase n=1 Tax=Halococcus sp. IIIV-5B TaxID=2321230 RepID=UPI000E749B8B|nr:1,4-dihydroxy-2-naphthoate polyprenyltransferase [Halococcus sp. IIIV-5B]RJT03331.1 1,4-dihydroxy-2-naphthoate polyprenyltransferase [Halococcus sp. IIIV-5B]